MVSVKMTGLTEALASLEEGVRTFGTVAEQAIYDGVASRGVDLAVAEVSMASPRPPVDSGAYRQGFKAVRVPGGASLTNSAVYAGVLENGRAAGRKAPPVNIIAQWVLRKGLADEPAAARRIAFAIARKMGKEGWPFAPNAPMRIIEKALNKFLPEIPALVAAAWANRQK